MISVLYEQTLYRINTNGTVGSWSIVVEANGDGTADLISMQTKVLGGAGVETRKTVATGKNIGKQNETTAQDQAVIDAQSTVTKKLKKGYLMEIPREGQQVTNSLGFSKPMLAKSIDKVSDWSFPVFTSPKLDGHRLLATAVDGNVVLYSRQGSKVDLPHISEELQLLFDQQQWDGTVLDGEVYLHGESLQTITSLIKKRQPLSESLIFHVFDLIDSKRAYEERFSMISRITNDHSNAVKIIDTHVANDSSELNILHTENLAEGYEGTMVRWSNAGYEDGKRSESLMKKKDFQDAEFKVVGVEKGESITRNGKLFELPIYVCETKHGTTFNCVASGSLEEKHKAWLDRDAAVGKLLTVKFFNYTDNNVPFLPVALSFRDDL